MPGAATSRLLIVEDDENLRLGLTDNLEDEGLIVVSAATLAEAREAIRRDEFDLLLLDIMLPDGDGYTFCQELRGAGFAGMILMLTARSLEEDLVRGFEAGADDYLAKPYRLAELLARVRALLRRRRATPEPVLPPLGKHRVDLEARRMLTADGQEVPLTKTEFDLAVAFLRHRGRALTRDEILDEVWGREVVVDHRTVDNFVSSLKRKLSWSADAGWQIQTVRGVGYRLELD